MLNNSMSFKNIFNKIVYDFIFNKSLNLFKLFVMIDYFKTRITIKNAIDFAQMINKYYYDCQH